MSPTLFMLIVSLATAFFAVIICRDRRRNKLLNVLRQKNAALEDLLSVIRLKIEIENDRAMGGEEK